MSRSHKNSLAGLQCVIGQHEVAGGQMRNEIAALTKIFDVKLAEISAENHRLRLKVDKLTKEAEEAKEMNGIYSARDSNYKTFLDLRHLQFVFSWANLRQY